MWHWKKCTITIKLPGAFRRLFWRGDTENALYCCYIGQHCKPQQLWLFSSDPSSTGLHRVTSQMLHFADHSRVFYRPCSQQWISMKSFKLVLGANGTGNFLCRPAKICRGGDCSILHLSYKHQNLKYATPYIKISLTKCQKQALYSLTVLIGASLFPNTCAVYNAMFDMGQHSLWFWFNNFLDALFILIQLGVTKMVWLPMAFLGSNRH